MSLRVAPLTSQALRDRLDDLASLRIAVFREWPYLYDGDMDYERAYMAAYAESDRAILVGAFDGERLVGAATGTPMEDHVDDFADPLTAVGLSETEVFYCAESVLLPDYRGRGIGHAFFDHREAHARALGRKTSAFCAVVRPAGHPLRPPEYRPLDDFWAKRGYAPLPGAVARFVWKDVDEAEPSAKSLQFWMRQLDHSSDGRQEEP